MTADDLLFTELEYSNAFGKVLNHSLTGRILAAHLTDTPEERREELAAPEDPRNPEKSDS